MLLNFDIIIDEFFVKVEGYIYFVLYIIYFQLLYFKNVECEFLFNYLQFMEVWVGGYILQIIKNCRKYIEFLCLVV